MAKTDWDGIRDTKKKDYSELVTKQADESIDRVNTLTDENIAQAEADTTKAIDKTTDDYVDILRSAGIQKELDLRDIQETRANMGLSRSGLSATEQTAAILSAGNKTAEAQRNRQKAIDSFNDGLEKYKREAESQRAADILKIEQQRDTDIFNNDQKWDNWAFEGKEAEKAANDTNLVTARTAGLIDDETLQLARDNGWSYEEAIKHYAPTKATNDYNSTILGWVQSGSISPELYQKIMKERPSLENATLWAIEAQKQKAKGAAKIEAEQKGIETTQAADDKRESDLYKANEKEWINDDTLKHAIINKLTLEEALVYEDENKIILRPTAAMYQGAVKAYTGGFGGEKKDEDALNAYLLSPELKDYDIDLIEQFAKNENNRPLIRFELVDERTGAVRDVITGRTYTSVQLRDTFEKQGYDRTIATNRVHEILVNLKKNQQG